MGTEALAVLCWLAISGACGKVINVSEVKDNEGAESSPRLYRDVPLGVYASAAPYGAFSFHVPVAVPAKPSPYIPVKRESVVIHNSNGFLKDSYGNKFVQSPQSVSYKTTFPQEFVQLQHLPAHLSQPLTAAPSYHFPQGPPQPFFGAQYRLPSFDTVTSPFTRYGVAQPFLYAGTVKSLTPASDQQFQFVTPKTLQESGNNQQEVYSTQPNNQVQQEPKSQRLEEKPAAYHIEHYDAPRQPQAAPSTYEKVTAPVKHTVKTVHNGQETVVQIETKPPLPLLDLSLLEPLMFDNPVVPQMQHFLPKISEATYYKLPELADVDEVKKHQNEFVVQKTKSYDSGLIKGKPHSDDSKKKQKKTPKKDTDVHVHYEQKSEKPSIKVKGKPNDPHYSYEINSPNYKETYNEQVVSYNKETQSDPISYTYQKDHQKEPVTYSYSHNSKDPGQTIKIQYVKKDPVPNQLIYNFQPSGKNVEHKEPPHPSPESDDSSESSEANDESPSYDHSQDNTQHDKPPHTHHSAPAYFHQSTPASYHQSHSSHSAPSHQHDKSPHSHNSNQASYSHQSTPSTYHQSHSSHSEPSHQHDNSPHSHNSNQASYSHQSTPSTYHQSYSSHSEPSSNSHTSTESRPSSQNRPPSNSHQSIQINPTIQSHPSTSSHPSTHSHPSSHSHYSAHPTSPSHSHQSHPQHLKAAHNGQAYRNPNQGHYSVNPKTSQKYAITPLRSGPHLQPLQEFVENLRFFPSYANAAIRVDPNQHVAPKQQQKQSPQYFVQQTTPRARSEGHLSSEPVIYEKSKKIIIQEESPEEVHSHQEKLTAQMVGQEENSEEDFEKSYKEAAYGFPAYNKDTQSEEDIYNPESYGEPQNSEEDTKNSPFEQYEEEGDEFPKFSRLGYKDARDKMKENYYLDYSIARPESMTDRYQSKINYYKMFMKQKPEKTFGHANDDKKKQKYTIAPSFFDSTPQQKTKSAAYKSAPLYEYDFSKDSRDSSAHASRPSLRLRTRTHFVEPQFQYGFEPIAIPRLDSELDAMASNVSPESEKSGTRKKLYKENWYIKKTRTSSKPS